jgi:hypothetical protein
MGMKKFEQAVPVCSIQDKIIRDASEKLRNTIDYNLLATMLVDAGWTRIDVEYKPPTHTWIEMKTWAEENCPKEHQEHMGIWLFKSKKDATIFSLKWA